MERIQLVNGLKFNANLVGGQTINGNSVLTLTKSSTASELVISFLELRCANTNNKETKELLNLILDEITDADDLIDELLIEDNLSSEDFIAKLKRSLKNNKKDPTYAIARKITKNCKSQLLNNVTKRRNKHMKIIEEYLKGLKIKSKLSTEKRIKLILDNFKGHTSKFILRIAKILNIDLIYLPKRSPHLNPIEQVWRLIKAEVRLIYIESQAHLERIIMETFPIKVEEISVDKWLDTFIN